MRSIRPIPRSALPDAMTVRTPLPDGTFEEPQIIANVRFERTQRVSDDDHRSADAGQGAAAYTYFRIDRAGQAGYLTAA